MRLVITVETRYETDTTLVNGEFIDKLTSMIQKHLDDKKIVTARSIGDTKKGKYIEIYEVNN